MAVPKHKTSKARRNSRVAHNFVVNAPTITECKQCHAPIPPHTVCPECGFYKGVKRIETKADKKAKKTAEKQQPTA
ncbi:MAG: 50S ribosomal protein L32 [Christensenellaceae bacterium]|nr:50S ribosomal protein L32 [Christensenellaceae bacterium]